ncbi:hypothetical protein [Agarilytica rhodophyticola]|uniref:hypothetical protein n=1 Tax=Agarilytica rhodophyticola TaxID=1737490 RepID=UPI000B34827B|nr:hypothetical protein [Agarilytica rhodophyticola]
MRSILVFISLSFCLSSFAGGEITVSYDIYLEKLRENKQDEAAAWLSKAVIDGNPRALLELSSKCLNENHCNDPVILRPLLKNLISSEDVYIRARAYLLMSQFTLKYEPGIKGELQALDYLLLASAYGEEGAIVKALPLFEKISKYNKDYAVFIYTILQKEILFTQKDSILYKEIQSQMNLLADKLKE